MAATQQMKQPLPGEFGSNEWAAKHLPHAFEKIKKDDPERDVTDAGWLYDGLTDKFNHPQYGARTFDYAQILVNGKYYKLPKAGEGFEDRKGLCFAICFDNKLQSWTWTQDRWVSYWETSDGLHQIDRKEYLKQRRKTKKRFAEMTEEQQKKERERIRLKKMEKMQKKSKKNKV